MWPGFKVIITPLAVTNVRLYPTSRHRSKRVEKKLIKRHGGTFRQAPGCYQADGNLVIHPVLWEQLKNDYRAKKLVTTSGDDPTIPGIGKFIKVSIGAAPKLDGNQAGISPQGW